MNTQRHAYVYFTTGQWSHKRRMSWRRRLRIVRKFKRRSYFWFLAWLVRTLTFSKLAHVSIGYNGAVLHPGILDNEYWPQIAYTLKYPTLTCAFTVPVNGPIDLDRYPKGAKQVWPTVRKWICYGWAPATQDCVDIVKDCLAQGGVTVPRNVLSPQDLHDWLEKHSYERTDLASSEVPGGAPAAAGMDGPGIP